MSARKRPKGSYRYSIVPAGAITDPDITPRDLQVLCLLGRHANDHGWCRRSQVTMGEELNCDRRTVQRALDRLVEAGYVQQKAEGRGNIPPPGQNEQPFAAHSYRVLLDLDGEDERATGAQNCAGEVRTDAHGVRANDAHGVRTSCAPLTEHTLCEDTPCEQTQRAREEPAAPDQDQKNSARSVFDERIWPEFLRCPGFSRENMPKATARRAFENLKPPIPQTGQMVDCIRGYSRWLAAQNAKRKPNDPFPMAHPSTWLHQRRFEGFLEIAAEGAAKAAISAKLSEKLEGDHALIAKEFGTAVYEKWFAGADISRGPPFVITTDSDFKRNWISTHFGGRLRRLFRIDVIGIELRRAEKAA